MTTQGNLQIRQYCLFWQILKIMWEKKCLIKQRKCSLKDTAPGLTSSVSTEVVLSNKDKNHIGQLFMRSLNCTI